MGGRLATLAAAAIITGVVALGSVATAVPALAAPEDTFETFNRRMFAFNNWLVQTVIEPVSTTLGDHIPLPLRIVAGNVYENLTEPEFAAANWLAGNGQGASDSLRRVIINTVFGIGGAYDVASMIGIRRHHIEFGAAVCETGLPTGPYLVLPLIGSTNAGVVSSTSVFFVGGFYLLNLISTWLATADLAIDLSASAASLRYSGELPDLAAQDPYRFHQMLYWAYLEHECSLLRQGQAPMVAGGESAGG